MKRVFLFIILVIIAIYSNSQDPDYSAKLLQKYKDMMEYSSSKDATFHDKLWLTPFLLEAERNLDRLTNDLALLIEEYIKKAGGFFTGDENITYYKNFAFHYTINSEEEENVSPVDNNGNNIPDYIDTMMYIFGNEVITLLHDELGYIIPPGDSNDLYHIYVSGANMGGGTLGFTRVTYEDYVGDNPNSPDVIEENAYRSTIYLRNTYDNYDEPLEYLRNTAVHEYMHAIQFGYNRDMETWFMEMCATYIESVAYPDDKTYYDYLDHFFSYPDIALNIEDNELLAPKHARGHWYSTWIFAKFLTEHTNDTIIKDLYVQSNDSSMIGVIDTVLRTRWQSNLREIFRQFIIANRFMTSDTAFSPYTYLNAESYDEYMMLHGGYKYEKDLYFTGTPVSFNSGIWGNLRLMRISADYFTIDTDQPFLITMECLLSYDELDIVLLKINNNNNTLEIENSQLISGNPTIEITNPEDYTDYILALIREDFDERAVFSAYYDIDITQPQPQAAAPLIPGNSSKVFPNPADDFVVIDLDAKDIEEYEIEIYDVFGRLIFKEHSTNLNDRLINTSTLPEGVYIINIRKGNDLLMNRTFFITH